MHMADALLAPAVAATMYVASGTAAGISVHKLKKDDEPQKLPTMAVTAALVFAGQMINYTIPGTGSNVFSLPTAACWPWGRMSGTWRSTAASSAII